MDGSNEIKEIVDSHKSYTISAFVSAFFMILWIALQWGVNWTIQNLPLEGIDQWVLYAFQVLFSISTLAPIVFNLYRDIRIMGIRTQKRILREQHDLKAMKNQLDLKGEVSSRISARDNDDSGNNQVVNE